MKKTIISIATAMTIMTVNVNAQEIKQIEKKTIISKMENFKGLSITKHFISDEIENYTVKIEEPLVFLKKIIKKIKKKDIKVIEQITKGMEFKIERNLKEKKAIIYLSKYGNDLESMIKNINKKRENGQLKNKYAIVVADEILQKKLISAEIDEVKKIIKIKDIKIYKNIKLEGLKINYSELFEISLNEFLFNDFIEKDKKAIINIKDLKITNKENQSGDVKLGFIDFLIVESNKYNSLKINNINVKSSLDLKEGKYIYDSELIIDRINLETTMNNKVKKIEINNFNLSSNLSGLKEEIINNLKNIVKKKIKDNKDNIIVKIDKKEEEEIRVQYMKIFNEGFKYKMNLNLTGKIDGKFVSDVKIKIKEIKILKNNNKDFKDPLENINAEIEIEVKIAKQYKNLIINNPMISSYIEIEEKNNDTILKLNIKVKNNHVKINDKEIM
jgi:hypothetical protein